MPLSLLSQPRATESFEAASSSQELICLVKSQITDCFRAFQCQQANTAPLLLEKTESQILHHCFSYFSLSLPSPLPPFIFSEKHLLVLKVSIFFSKRKHQCENLECLYSQERLLPYKSSLK